MFLTVFYDSQSKVVTYDFTIIVAIRLLLSTTKSKLQIAPVWQEVQEVGLGRWFEPEIFHSSNFLYFWAYF